MLEYEKKVLITENEYDAIVNTWCNGIKPKIQINYYFDTDDLYMNKKGITCRIRAKDGKYKTTVKNHNTVRNDGSMEIDLCEQNKLDTKFFDALGLCHQGELVTERIVMYKDSFCEMVIDRNTYLGHTDFEIEVEYSEDCEQVADYLLMTVAKMLVNYTGMECIDKFLKRVGKAKSKSKRFFGRKTTLKSSHKK